MTVTLQHQFDAQREAMRQDAERARLARADAACMAATRAALDAAEIFVRFGRPLSTARSREP